MPPIAVGRVENPNGHHSVAVWVRFGFQLDSLEKHLITLTGLTFTPYSGCTDDDVQVLVRKLDLPKAELNTKH